MAFGVTVGWSQNKQILYGFSDIPQSLMVNPGSKTELQKHLGIPLFSQIHVSGGMSGLSLFDIFGQTGEDINDKIRRKVFEMDEKDFFTVNQQLEIINFGWRSAEDIYFSAGMYQEFDFIFYFPSDFAQLALDGNVPYIGRGFDFNHVNSRADVLTTYHFGANKRLGKKLTVGARVKLYSSILSYNSTNNQGTFTTTQTAGTPNIYEHRIENANIEIQTSGIYGLDDGSAGSKLIGRALLSGNFGVGLDLGATYDINPNWTVSGSVQDLGAIFHSKDATVIKAQGDYTLDGIELLFPPLGPTDDPFPYYDDLEDEIDAEIPIEEVEESYTNLRPLKLNGSLSYNFGEVIGGQGDCDCRNSGGGGSRSQELGVQYFSISRPRGMQMAGTLYYYRRISDFLSAKATYTVDPYTSSNVGLGASATFGKFNFYVAADNLLDYGNLAKAKSVSLQLGFNIKIDQE